MRRRKSRMVSFPSKGHGRVSRELFPWVLGREDCAVSGIRVIIASESGKGGMSFTFSAEMSGSGGLDVR